MHVRHPEVSMRVMELDGAFVVELQKKLSAKENNFSTICETRPGLVINIPFSSRFYSPALLKIWPL